MKKIISFLFVLAICIGTNAQGISLSPKSKAPQNKEQKEKSIQKMDKIHGVSQTNVPEDFYRGQTRGIKQIGYEAQPEEYPIEPHYSYSYSQSIYLQSELGQADNITRIWYYFAGNTLANSNEWVIYMGHTSKTQYSSVNDWIPITHLTEVYNSTFTDPGAPGWIMFDITDFAYNGTDNLVIAIDENSDNSENSNDRFYGSAVTGQRSLVYYDDETNPNPSAPPESGRFEMVIPNIRLSFGEPLDQDLAVIEISPKYILSGATATPKVRIINYGVNNESTWSITLTDGASYNETLNNPTTINGGGIAVLTFPNWAPADGTYELTASISLIGDEDASNDILTQNTTVATGVNMSNGSTTTCLAVFFDSGSFNSYYQSNENYTFTFNPGTPGDYIQIEFLSFDTERNYDILNIYNGTNISAELIQSFSGTNPTSVPIKANNPDGALTFNFHSDGISNKAGWQAIISCYTPPAHDLGIISITPNIVAANSSREPLVTVHNYGLSTEETYNINLSIAGTTYNETVTGITVSPNGEVILDFPVWNTPLAGTYQMTASVILSSDTDASNNTKTSECEVVKFSYKLGYNYGYDRFSDYIVRNSIETGIVENLAHNYNYNDITCGEYIDGVVYGIEEYSNDIYAINGDGAKYLVGTIPLNYRIFGIAYDHIHGDIYVTNYDYDEYVSNLYTLNSDFSTNYIGSIGTYMVHSIATDANGDLFGIGDDGYYKFISINKTTGAGTIIGPLGISGNFADIGGDKVNDVIYGTIHSSVENDFDWYTIDKTTGTATLISNFGTQITMCAIVNEITYSVTVNVTDGTAPIEGASVVCSDLSIDVSTDINGIATFEAPAGTNYDLTVSVTGYIDYVSTFNVVDQDITIPVALGATNIDDIKTNISVVPNPTNGIISISADQNYMVQVLDLTGRIIESVNMNNNDISIDLSSKNNGMYIIRLTNGNGTKTVKVIKK